MKDVKNGVEDEIKAATVREVELSSFDVETSFKVWAEISEVRELSLEVDLGIQVGMKTRDGVGQTVTVAGFEEVFCDATGGWHLGSKYNIEIHNIGASLIQML